MPKRGSSNSPMGSAEPQHSGYSSNSIAPKVGQIWFCVAEGLFKWNYRPRDNSMGRCTTNVTVSAVRRRGWCNDYHGYNERRAGGSGIKELSTAYREGIFMRDFFVFRQMKKSTFCDGHSMCIWFCWNYHFWKNYRIIFHRFFGRIFFLKKYTKNFFYD